MESFAEVRRARGAAIAASFGAIVDHFPWTGRFDEARNRALDVAAASGPFDYVLSVDADERVSLTSDTPGDWREILDPSRHIGGVMTFEQSPGLYPYVEFRVFALRREIRWERVRMGTDRVEAPWWSVAASHDSVCAAAYGNVLLLEQQRFSILRPRFEAILTEARSFFPDYDIFRLIQIESLAAKGVLESLLMLGLCLLEEPPRRRDGVDRRLFDTHFVFLVLDIALAVSPFMPWEHDAVLALAPDVVLSAGPEPDLLAVERSKTRLVLGGTAAFVAAFLVERIGRAPIGSCVSLRIRGSLQRPSLISASVYSPGRRRGAATRGGRTTAGRARTCPRTSSSNRPPPRPPRPHRA